MSLVQAAPSSAKCRMFTPSPDRPGFSQEATLLLLLSFLGHRHARHSEPPENRASPRTAWTCLPLSWNPDAPCKSPCSKGQTPGSRQRSRSQRHRRNRSQYRMMAPEQKYADGSSLRRKSWRRGRHFSSFLGLQRCYPWRHPSRGAGRNACPSLPCRRASSHRPAAPLCSPLSCLCRP